MSMTAADRGKPGRLLLRLARRFTGPAACEHVFEPLVADFQFEHGRADTSRERLHVRVRWIAAFWQTLGQEALHVSAAHLRANSWGTTPDQRLAATRLVRITAAAAVSWALAAAIYALKRPLLRSQLDGPGHWVLLLPSALEVALPAGVLFGVVLSVREWRTHHWRPLLGLATLVGLGTFALAAWVTPPANGAYMERSWLHLVASTPGEGAPLSRVRREHPRELTLQALSERAAEARRGSWGAVLAPAYEVEWHKKPVLGASCLALSLAGAGIVRRLRRRAYRWAAGLLVLASWFWMLQLGEQAGEMRGVPPALAMWGPLLAVAVIGMVLGGRSAAAGTAISVRPPRPFPPASS
jgi:hypothetical protein